MVIDNKIILKNKEATPETSILGISGENEQQRLVFSFEDGFVDGTCNLELEFPDGKKGWFELKKEDETYWAIVKNSLLTQAGDIKMELKIIQKTEVWKSLPFSMAVIEAINAVETIEEDYPNWVEDMTIQMQELKEGVSQIAKDVESIETFSGDYNDLENKPDSVSNNDIDKFFHFEQFYRVDVIGGCVIESQKTVDGWYSKGMSITVVANEAPIGKKFGWWNVLKGTDESKVGSSNYSFSLYSDTVLEAVFVDEGEIVDALISITLEANLNTHATKGDCIRLYSALLLPTAYKKLDFGILVCFGENTELRLDNEKVGKFPAKPTNTSYAYNYPISDCAEKVLRSKAFVIFEKDGTTETMYSSELRVDVDLEYAVYQELEGGKI